MGRAERRRAERRDRIEERKGKILVSPAELNRVKRDIAYKASCSNNEYLMTCFALALHRLYGFEAEEIGEALRCIDGFMTDILNDTSTMDDYIKELEEKTGVIVKCEE